MCKVVSLEVIDDENAIAFLSGGDDLDITYTGDTELSVLGSSVYAEMFGDVDVFLGAMEHLDAYEYNYLKDVFNLNKSEILDMLPSAVAQYKMNKGEC